MKSNLLKPLTFLDVFVRFFSGFGAGIAGSVILLIVLFLGWGIVGNTLSPDTVATNEFGVATVTTGTHPLFAYFIVLAVFLGVLAANISHILMSTVVSEHYAFRTTLLTNVFFGNLILLILMIPVYIIMNGYFGHIAIGVAALIHAVLSAILSFFILEVINWSKHLLVNLYGLVIGLILFTIVAVLFFSNKTVLAFFVFPFLFGFLSMGNAIAQAVYEWFYKAYGNDFLNIDTRFGDDYGQE